MKDRASHKQILYFSIINYFGVLLGIVSTLFIYPYDKELLGTIRYIDALAQIIFPMVLLGASHALINFYPMLDADRRKQLFRYSVFSVFLISIFFFVLLSVFLVCVKKDILHYIYLAFPIAIALAYVELFKKQATTIHKIAVPTFIEKIVPKIALPLIFICFLKHFITTNEATRFYICSYIFLSIVLAIYLFYHYKPEFKLWFNGLFTTFSKKEYYKYSFYSFAGSFGSFFAFRVDLLMIPEFISKEANGTYSIGVTLSSVLLIPATGIFMFYAPMISNYIKNNNLKELGVKYKETSKLLFFIGGLFYSCIFLGIDTLFKMLPTYDSLKGSIPVILISGFNVLVNMATGFNTEIISYSKYYKFNMITILLLIVLNVSLNIVFLRTTDLGIVGIAYASLLSVIIFNLSKLFFIYKKFGLFPFDKSFAGILLSFILVGIFIYMLPEWQNQAVGFGFKIGLCLTINIFLVYRLKLLFQVNYWIDKIFNICK